MTINHDKKLTSFFNMPVKEVTGMRGKPDRVSRVKKPVCQLANTCSGSSTYSIEWVGEPD